jgi:hypothetical protein
MTKPPAALPPALRAAKPGISSALAQVPFVSSTTKAWVTVDETA